MGYTVAAAEALTSWCGSACKLNASTVHRDVQSGAIVVCVWDGWPQMTISSKYSWPPFNDSLKIMNKVLVLLPSEQTKLRGQTPWRICSLALTCWGSSSPSYPGRPALCSEVSMLILSSLWIIPSEH